MSRQQPEKLVQAPKPSEAVLLAEYTALRAESLKSIEIQNQLIQLTLVVAGTSYTVGLQNSSIPGAAIAVLLVYPILAMFLSAGWIHNARRMSRINVYIQDKLSKPLLGLKWEEYPFTKQKNSFWRAFYSFNIIYVFGIFFGTQLLAILLVLFQFKFSFSIIIQRPIQERVLLIAAIFSLAGTFFLLTEYLRRFEQSV